MVEKSSNEEEKDALQKELQSRVVTFKALESNLANFARQKDLLTARLMEMQNTAISVEELHKSKSDTLFSVGSGAFVKGNPRDRDKIIIEIGAGIALEKTVDEAREILETRKKDIENAINNTHLEMNKIMIAMQKLENETRMILSGEMPIGSEGKDEKFKVISD